MLAMVTILHEIAHHNNSSANLHLYQPQRSEGLSRVNTNDKTKRINIKKSIFMGLLN